MPRLMTDEAREKHEAKIRERRIYAGQKIEEVLPRPTEDPLPVKTLCEKATEAARKNGLMEHPFFGKAKRPAARFLSFTINNWGGKNGIRQVMLDDLGIFVEFGSGLAGVRRAGKRGAAATLAWSQKVVSAGIDAHNELASGAKMFQLPAYGFQMKLFPVM